VTAVLSAATEWPRAAKPVADSFLEDKGARGKQKDLSGFLVTDGPGFSVLPFSQGKTVCPCFFLGNADEVGKHRQLVHVRKLPSPLEQLHDMREIIHVVCPVLYATPDFVSLPIWASLFALDHIRDVVSSRLC
jgi:hypothetical protein